MRSGGGRKGRRLYFRVLRLFSIYYGRFARAGGANNMCYRYVLWTPRAFAWYLVQIWLS